jgi:hypothetical protein
LIMTILCFILICRTYCIQILREYLYFQNWNWEKNFEVCTLQRTTSRQMVSTFIFGINKCMQKDWKKGTGVKLCTINVLSLLSLRSIWTGMTSSAATSAYIKVLTIWREVVRCSVHTSKFFSQFQLWKYKNSLNIWIQWVLQMVMINA